MMTADKIIVIAIAVFVAGLATVTIYLGLLNWVGGFHVVHCSECGHLTGSSVNKPAVSCPHCRHPLLTHPFYARRHPAAKIRVRNDPLRY
jgi:hypothetical protein